MGYTYGEYISEADSEFIMEGGGIPGWVDFNLTCVIVFHNFNRIFLLLNN